jgi:hypothetical protein
MNATTTELLDRIRRIEEEMEQQLKRRRAELHADFDQRRVRFESEVLEQQRRFKIGLMSYLLCADWRNVISAPFIYAVFFPLLLLDVCVTLYQFVCFPLYRIERVRRRDYLVFDRAHLGYLNLLEKINCAYCSYATGLASFVKEVIGRTEQYWCPIKHARRILQAHPHYSGFVDFGDAQAYREQLRSLRADLAQLNDIRSSI